MISLQLLINDQIHFFLLIIGSKDKSITFNFLPPINPISFIPHLRVKTVSTSLIFYRTNILDLVMVKFNFELSRFSFSISLKEHNYVIRRRRDGWWILNNNFFFVSMKISVWTLGLLIIIMVNIFGSLFTV